MTAGHCVAVRRTQSPEDSACCQPLRPSEHERRTVRAHRGHARVEDRIRQGKDCGLRNLPFKSFDDNRVWLWLVGLAQDLLAWTAQLCLADAARAWELKRLRYRLLHQSGRIARHARQTILRLAHDWPWSGQLADAFAKLQALPALA